MVGTAYMAPSPDAAPFVEVGAKIAEGDTIIKYGEDIGKMTGDAGKGGHVHVHNLKTKRW